MRNLLQANLRRMVRSRAFLIAVLAELAYTALVVLVCWDHYAAGGYLYTLESILTAGYGLMGYLSIPSFIAAPLLSVYLGTEYTDRTFRNRLIVGHTRSEVYLSQLIVSVLAALALDVLYLLLAGALCVRPVLGMASVLLRVSAGQMMAWIAVGLLARAAFAAVLVLVVTALGSRTSGSIAALLLVVGASVFCAFGFHQLQYLASHPDAPAQAFRLTLWQMLMDLLPTGQYLQVSRLLTPNLWRLPLLSLAVIAVSTAAGLFLFCRKDLK